VSQLPKPQPRPTKKVQVRDLDRGVPRSANSGHTSFRLDDDDKRRLKLLAKKKYGGITKSAALRIMIREAAAKEGIE
jgi:hypothetical protein